MAAVLLNQPQPRAGMAARTLRAAGRTVIELPGHRLLPDTTGQQRLQGLATDAYDRVIFVSPSSVMFAEAVLAGRLRTGQLACIGQGTATVLHNNPSFATGEAGEHVIRPRQPPFDAAALMRLDGMQPGQVRRLLVVAGANARTDWIDAARARGIDCELATVYHSEPVEPDERAGQQLDTLAGDEQPALLVVGSVAEFNRLLRWLEHGSDNATQRAMPREATVLWLRAQAALAPHGRIAAHMVQAGWTAVQTTRAGQTLLDAALELSD